MFIFGYSAKLVKRTQVAASKLARMAARTALKEIMHVSICEEL